MQIYRIHFSIHLSIHLTDTSDIMNQRLRFTARFGALCGALTLAFAPAAIVHAQPAAKVSGVVSTQARQQLDQLAETYYDEVARYSPVGATQNGDNRFDDQIGMAIAPKVRARHFAQYRVFQQRLHAIKRAHLDLRAQINYDVLDYELTSALTFARLPEHLLPLDQMDSMPVTLANFASGEGAQRLTTVKQFRAYLNRLNQLPAWIDQAIANMREGMRVQVVLPKAAMVSALPAFQKLVSATPEASIFYTPVNKMPATFSASDKKALTDAYRKSIDTALAPALARLATFLEKEYLPATRTSSGWNALPEGQAWYQASVAASTTTSMTPEQIHAIGLKEVARIQREYGVVGPKMGA